MAPLKIGKTKNLIFYPLNVRICLLLNFALFFSVFSASVEYGVRSPYVPLFPEPSFSEPKFVLKHEKVLYHAIVVNPEAYNYGLVIEIIIQPVEEILRMRFVEEDPEWIIGDNLVAILPDNENATTHNETGHLLISPDDIKVTISEDDREPRVTWEMYSASGIVLDHIKLNVEPFINLWDNKNSDADRIHVWFQTRVLTDVSPGMELPVQILARYTHVGLTRGNRKALTVTDQPFIPLIPPDNITQYPDTGDDIVFNFDLSLNISWIDFHVNDTWMNVTCPDLCIVPDTLFLDFYEPENVTEESNYDQAFVTNTTYHIHLISIYPEVHLIGNQTFLLWDNTMVTHQEIICYAMLSYRKEGAALVLPYVAGESPALTMPGISYELYRLRDEEVVDYKYVGNETEIAEDDEDDDDDQLFELPVGANITYILDITFPELTTAVRFCLVKSLDHDCF